MSTSDLTLKPLVAFSRNLSRKLYYPDHDFSSIKIVYLILCHENKVIIIIKYYVQSMRKISPKNYFTNHIWYEGDSNASLGDLITFVIGQVYLDWIFFCNFRAAVCFDSYRE